MPSDHAHQAVYLRKRQRQTALMDRIYRHQRYIYNITRKVILPGRDALLRAMMIRPGDHVLEVGCGTARNLMWLARAYPAAHFFGLDVSSVMLAYANRRISRAGYENVRLMLGAAEDGNYKTLFALQRPFDKIFFSYSLSMIRNWKGALCSAISNMTAGGTIYIVDFWDFADLPLSLRVLLRRWLARYHVRHDPDLLKAIRQLGQTRWARLQLESVGPRYGFKAVLADVNLQESLVVLNR